jgi:hypothetical protein
MLSTIVGVRISGMWQIRQLSMARLITLSVKVRRDICNLSETSQKHIHSDSTHLVVDKHHVNYRFHAELVMVRLLFGGDRLLNDPNSGNCSGLC